MFNLRVVQANHGDCFILEYGSEDSPRYSLIDGGPAGAFDRYLDSEVRRIADTGGKFDVAAISHVDGDHITGLLDLLATIRDQRTNGMADLIGIDALWHNSFAKAIDRNFEIAPRLRNLLAMSAAAATPLSAMALAGLDQGNRVRQLAAQLSISLNEGFAADLICVDDAPEVRELGNLSLQIVGPTRANLDALRAEWLEWLDTLGPNLASGDPMLMANADISTPNLSSIMFVATADNKTVLFTGDGRSDHLLSGLRASNLLQDGGTLHVDVLKVMHHGSDRNATKTFFKTVTADTYVISANGHPDNPDLATLIWIVEAAKSQGREIHLIFTNERPTTRKLLTEYPSADFGYRMTVFMPGQSSMVIPLSA